MLLSGVKRQMRLYTLVQRMKICKHAYALLEFVDSRHAST